MMYSSVFLCIPRGCLVRCIVECWGGTNCYDVDSCVSCILYLLSRHGSDTRQILSIMLIHRYSLRCPAQCPSFYFLLKSRRKHIRIYYFKRLYDALMQVGQYVPCYSNKIFVTKCDRHLEKRGTNRWARKFLFF